MTNCSINKRPVLGYLKSLTMASAEDIGLVSRCTSVLNSVQEMMKLRANLMELVETDCTSMFADFSSAPQPPFQDIALALDCMNQTDCGLWVEERQGFGFLYH